MRVFLIWPDKSYEVVKMLQELEKHSHEVLYWLGYDDSEAHRFPKTIFHSYQDALWAIPPKGIDAFEFIPPDVNAVSRLFDTELTVLTMMNNFVPGKNNVEERKHLYYHLLGYWLGMIKRYQPEAIIFSYVPHYVYDYVLFSVAKLLGIKTIMFLDTRIPGRTLMMDDFYIGSTRLLKELENNKNKDFQIADLSEDIHSCYLRYSDRNLTEPPPHIRFQKNKYSLSYRFFRSSKIFESIKDFSILERGFNFLIRFLKNINRKSVLSFLSSLLVLAGDNLKKEYRRVQSTPDLSKNFVYVPLSVQPECSTSPQGGIFVDQILMIEILASVLPDNWVIYVKEHPIQWLRFGVGFSGYKYQGYYEVISKIKNVFLIPLETNSYKLINESQAVATTTGAAGWEALLRSHPLIIFGYPWYKDCPGLFRVSDVESCRSAFSKIVAGFKPNKQNLMRYLKALEMVTLRAYIANSAGNGSGLTKEESMKNITKAILNELKEF